MKEKITKEQLDLLKDLDLEEILKKVETRIQKPVYRCSMCYDTKRVHVCGGQSRSCPQCGPRFK